MKIALTVSVMGALAFGCASLSRSDPAEEVLATMKAYIESMAAQDVDALVAFFSEDWEGEGGVGKEVLRGYFEGQIDQGLYDDIEVILDDTEVVVDGNTATMGPVDYESSQGSSAYEYEMTKEADGVWRCTYSGQI
jgi:ketosteroid isomerase-like protein